MAKHEERSKADDGSIAGVVELVTTYAKQETIEPLKGAGRFLAYGGGGAAVVGLGMALILFGALRLVQTEWTWAARGSWSWIAYLPVVAVGALVILVAVLRINRPSVDPVHEPIGAIAERDQH